MYKIVFISFKDNITHEEGYWQTSKPYEIAKEECCNRFGASLIYFSKSRVIKQDYSLTVFSTNWLSGV